MRPTWLWAFGRYLRHRLFTWMGLCPVRDLRWPSYREEYGNVAGMKPAILAAPRCIERDAEGRTLWSTVLGTFWLPAGEASNWLVRSGVAEQLSNIYGYVPSPLGSDIVLDCGANIGLFARFALSRGARLVVAVEPAPENLLCLRRNLEKEIAEGRVVVCEQGVWDVEDKLLLKTDFASSASCCVVAGSVTGPGVYVPLTTIDKLTQSLGLDHVDFIKLDVEGAEVRAIAGGRDLIARCRPTMGVATEHTDDILENGRNVIAAVRSIDGSFRSVCTQAKVLQSRSAGRSLTPLSLVFTH